jgi:hypothetical protein
MARLVVHALLCLLHVLRAEVLGATLDLL